MLQEIVAYSYQIGFSFSIFVLISLGLAVIFGMMRVINLAQGEFLMLGAYASIYAVKAGINIWLSFLVAAIAVGIFGMFVERVLIRFLYGRLMDTLLATWGLSSVPGRRHHHLAWPPDRERRRRSWLRHGLRTSPCRYMDWS